MGNGDGMFKKTDKAYIKKGIENLQPIGEYILIRRVAGQTAGNPMQGVQPTLSYKTKKTTAVINRLTPEELSASGGLYQFGDLKVELLEELNFADDQKDTIGDRIIYQKTSYRVVGRPDNKTIENTNTHFSYIMRKVGNQ